MKKTTPCAKAPFLTTLLMAVALFLSSPAFAQLSEDQGMDMDFLSAPENQSGDKPKATKSMYVAMLWQKLLGGSPDFIGWVQNSPDYAKADAKTQMDMIKTRATEMDQTYSLLTPTEPVVAYFTTSMVYNRKKGGFTLRKWNNHTYFNYGYLGQRYALIPNGIDKFLFLKAPQTLVKPMLDGTDNGKKTTLEITLVPQKADPDPLRIGKNDYRLILADILKINMWSTDGKNILWDSSIMAPDEILNLYQ